MESPELKPSERVENTVSETPKVELNTVEQAYQQGGLEFLQNKIDRLERVKTSINKGEYLIVPLQTDFRWESGSKFKVLFSEMYRRRLENTEGEVVGSSMRGSSIVCIDGKTYEVVKKDSIVDDSIVCLDLEQVEKDGYYWKNIKLVHGLGKTTVGTNIPSERARKNGQESISYDPREARDPMKSHPWHGAGV